MPGAIMRALTSGTFGPNLGPNLGSGRMKHVVDETGFGRNWTDETGRMKHVVDETGLGRNGTDETGRMKRDG